MKRYVIRDMNGLYRPQYGWIKYGPIEDAQLYGDKDSAIFYCPTNCEVIEVELTVIEIKG